MATSKTVKMSFLHEGHSFDYDLGHTLQPKNFAWGANVHCDGEKIGEVSGVYDQWAVPPENWNEGFLVAMAVFEVENKIRKRDGMDW
jgi:hypothetical protein